jgi:serine protease AprX
MLTGPVDADQIPRVSAGLARALATRPEQPVAVWVYFTDRAGAEHESRALAAARDRLTVRSLARRARRGSLPDLVAGDLPVHEPYLLALVARGAKLRGASRWLNAASVEIPPSLAVELARLPFVSRVALVPTGRPMRPVREIDPDPAPDVTAPGAETRDDGTTAGPAAAAGIASVPGEQAFYGGSFRQLDMMQVPALHALGLSGSGVLVAMLDSGFRITHEVFAGLDVVATRDFIHGDLNVDDDPNQDVPGQMTHGTWTLACVAGHKPGTFSGGAFAASVALGKTEDIGSETPVEMDYWQFGAEWADSLGADVISSSLGYSEFDNVADSYLYADMDGRTTVVTLAAAEAARRGITVVNSAGNEGAFAWHFIIAPADADSILSVGAVDSFNVVTSFSSRGPTADGRIKPDVTAMGRRVLLPTPTVATNYERQSGTSFSAPLTSSLVALLLESHPGWGPVQVREALRETALNHATPDNDIGWGLVQGLTANAFVPVTGVGPGTVTAATGLQLSAGPNPVRGGSPATIRFAAPGSGAVGIDVVDIGGRRRGRLFEGSATSERIIAWRAQDGNGAPLPAGIYWIRLAEIPSEGTASTAAASRGLTRTVRVVVLP